MEVILYRNTSDPNHLEPSLSDPLTFSDVVIKRETDVDLLELEISTSTNLAGYNYAKVAHFGRFYWCDTKVVRNGLWALHCESDPLYSFRTDIKNIRGTVDRAEQLYNGYVTDPNYIALAPMEYTFKKFPSGVDDNTLVLMTVG